MSQVFDNGVLHPVYYKIKEVNGKAQFRRAPFDVLVINGAPHIMPQVGGAPNTALAPLATDGENLDMWRGDFAYETLEPIVVDECQVGDGSNTWLGMTKISNL